MKILLFDSDEDFEKNIHTSITFDICNYDGVDMAIQARKLRLDNK